MKKLGVKEYKEAYEALLESAGDGIFTLDIKGNFTFFNRKAQERTGYRPEKIVGKHFTETGLVPQEYVPKLVKDFESMITDKKSRRYEFEIIAKNGERLLLDFNFTPLMREGNVVGVLGISRDKTYVKKLEAEKSALQEKVIGLSKNLLLTQKEKLVFYGLVRYPNLNDPHLSKKLKIKRSTVTAIRNRLMREGYYTTVNIPNLYAIGCERMTFEYGRYNPKIPFEVKKRALVNIVKKFPEFVQSLNTETEFFHTIVSENLATYRQAHDALDQANAKSKVLSEEGIHTVHFPLKSSKITRFLDFAPLLRNLFGLEVAEGESRSQSTEFHETRLRKRDGLVLYALTKHPEAPHKDIAEMVGISKPAVSRIRKKLFKHDYLQTARIPNFNKLGSELVVFTHVSFDPKYGLNEREESLSKVLKKCPFVFNICKDTEGVGILLCKNYTEFKRVSEAYGIDFHAKFFSKPPTRIMFPMKQIRFLKVLEFAPLVKRRLGIKEAF